MDELKNGIDAMVKASTTDKVDVKPKPSIPADKLANMNTATDIEKEVFKTPITRKNAAAIAKAPTSKVNSQPKRTVTEMASGSLYEDKEGNRTLIPQEIVSKLKKLGYNDEDIYKQYEYHKKDMVDPDDPRKITDDDVYGYMRSHLDDNAILPKNTKNNSTPKSAYKDLSDDDLYEDLADNQHWYGNAKDVNQVADTMSKRLGVSPKRALDFAKKNWKGEKTWFSVDPDELDELINHAHNTYDQEFRGDKAAEGFIKDYEFGNMDENFDPSKDYKLRDDEKAYIKKRFNELRPNQPKEEPLHIRSLKQQVAGNPHYKQMADSITNNKELNDAYFYAFKDAHEKAGYNPSHKDIANELENAYWQLSDNFIEGRGMSQGEWDRYGWAEFERKYGTEADFIDNGINAYNKFMDNLGPKPQNYDAEFFRKAGEEDWTLDQLRDKIGRSTTNEEFKQFIYPKMLKFYDEWKADGYSDEDVREEMKDAFGYDDLIEKVFQEKAVNMNEAKVNEPTPKLNWDNVEEAIFNANVPQHSEVGYDGCLHGFNSRKEATETADFIESKFKTQTDVIRDGDDWKIKVYGLY